MVFVELGIEALVFACVDVQNGTKSLSRSGKNLRQAIRERYPTPGLRDPVQPLRASIVLTDRRAAFSSIAPAETLFSGWHRPLRLHT